MIKILTQEIYDFIMDNYKGRTVPELAKLIEKEFEQEVNVAKLTHWLKDRRLRNGVDTRFWSEKYRENHEKKFKKKYVRMSTIGKAQREAEDILKKVRNER